MKAALCIVVWLSISNGIFANEPDLEYIRKQYEKAATDKNVCQTMIAELRNHTESDIHLAYLGAYQTIWANHTTGAFSKFNTFNKGKKNIEQAVKENPNNVEIRMIRLSVQKNCPAFLGYNDNIVQDRHYLEKYKSTVSSVVLLRMISGLLSE